MIFELQIKLQIAIFDLFRYNSEVTQLFGSNKAAVKVSTRVKI